jgi:hypothetical protein
MKKSAHLLTLLLFAGATYCASNNAPEGGAEDRIASYTFWLMIATIALGVVAIFQMAVLLKTDKTARIAAEAAKKTADTTEKALIGLESPYLYPVALNVDSLYQILRSIGSSNTPQYATAIQITIKNFGRSPGLPAFISCVLYMGEADDEKTDLEAGPHSGSMLAAGETSPMSISRNFGRPLGPQECQEMLDGRLTIYLKGSIQFVDLFDSEYLQYFCLRWSHVSHQFVAWGPSRNQRKRKGA